MRVLELQRHRLFTGVCWLALLGGTPNILTAGMIESQDSTVQGTSAQPRAENLDFLKGVCGQDLIRQHLERVGLSAEEVNLRLDNLSDAELAEMARRIDQVLPGGQDDFSERPLYKRLGIYVIWVLAIVLVIVVFIGVGNNVGGP